MVVSSRVFKVKLMEKNSGKYILWIALMKIVAVRAFIIMMLVYSAIKNSANGPAAYSTLNPDTSSDSPSVRSNGARFVSASVEMNHIIAKGHDGSRSQVCS